MHNKDVLGYISLDVITYEYSYNLYLYREQKEFQLAAMHQSPSNKQNTLHFLGGSLVNWLKNSVNFQLLKGERAVPSLQMVDFMVCGEVNGKSITLMCSVEGDRMLANFSLADEYESSDSDLPIYELILIRKLVNKKPQSQTARTGYTRSKYRCGECGHYPKKNTHQCNKVLAADQKKRQEEKEKKKHAMGSIEEK